MTQKALKLALEALERYGNRHRATYLLDGAWDAEITLGDKAIAAIKEALAQRTWVGLTDDDWKEIEDMPDTFDQGVAWAQAKLKEKNT